VSRRRPGGRPSGPGPTPERREEFDGETYLVRPIRGSSSSKDYRCPGCDLEIRPATPHVVVWPEHRGSADRRHWHTACWSARERRRPLS
jgi:hypothetical protein